MTPGDSWELIYEGGWSSYEEHDVLEIWETPDGDLWACRSSHSVMAYGPQDEEWWQVNWTDAIALVDEFGERESDCEYSD